MANTVSLLSYANTFGDWVVTTNALVRENNDLAANNYIKPTGTLYLNSPTLGLQVANVAIIAGALQVQGIGSSAYVQNNLRVDTQVYFQNTILGLTNSGQANINGLLIAQGPGTGLYVANTANIGGTLNVVGATALGNTLSVTKATTLSNTLTVTGISTFTSNVNAQNYINVSQDVNAINFIGTGSVNSYGLSVIGNGNFTGQVSVGGNFVINGTTVYNSNRFQINANSAVGLSSYLNVYRGASANAEIRWNESSKYWDIRDVDNPTSYSKILTANLITDSVTTVNSNLLASATAANTLNNYLAANVAILQAQLSANGSSSNSQIAIIQGTNVTQNTRLTVIEGTDISQNTTIVVIQGVDVTQNTRLTVIEGTNVTQNTNIAATDGKMSSAYDQANTGVINASATNGKMQSSYDQANTATNNASATNGKMESAFTQANTAVTNVAATNSKMSSAYNQANTGTVLAQASFDSANTKVSSITGTTNQIIVTGTTAPTLSLPQSISTGASVQFGSVGVGTAASGTSGEVRATNNITAYYSDDRLKTRLGNIENALAKVLTLNGFQYEANETAQALGYTVRPEIGLSAQEVQAVLPEVVVPAPIDDKYLTIHYERVIPLLVEAIKELSREIDELKKK
jgi:hypothetical protein